MNNTNLKVNKNINVLNFLTKEEVENIKKQDVSQKTKKTIAAVSIATTIVASSGMMNSSVGEEQKAIETVTKKEVISEKVAVKTVTPPKKVVIEKEVIKTATVLSPVADTYTSKKWESGIAITTVGAEKKTFSPIAGEVVAKTNNSLTVKNNDITLEIINIVPQNIENGDKVELGDQIGSSSKETIVLKPLVEEIKEIVVSGKSSEFNYLQKVYEGKNEVGIDASKDVAFIQEKVKTASETVVGSDVLKGMQISNKNEAALLQSNELFYSNEKISLDALKNGNMTANVSDAVRSLENIVVDVLNKKNLAQYSEFVLVIIQKESGGNAEVLAGDAMQSSQAKNGKVGSIKSTSESIQKGVELLTSLLNYAEKNKQSVDARFVIQSYNYGGRLLRDSVEEDMKYTIAYHVDKTPEYRSGELKRGVELTGDKVDWLENSYGDHTYTAKVMNMMTFKENAQLTFVEQTEGIAGVVAVQEVAKTNETIKSQPVETVQSKEVTQTTTVDKNILDMTLEEVKKTSNKELEKMYRSLNSETLNGLLNGNYKKKFLDDVFLELDNILAADAKLKAAKEKTAVKYDLSGKKIYVDPGHGNATDSGKNAPGAISKNGLTELKQAHKEAVALKAVLESAGAEVLISRPAEGKGDSYSQRIAEASNFGADLIVTMHQNASEKTEVRGMLTMFEYDNMESQKLATSTQNEISKNLQGIIEDRKLMKGDDSDKFGNHLGMFAKDFPVILTENGFMSNPLDVALMSNQTYVEIFTTSIANGIGDYFNATTLSNEEKEEKVEIEENTNTKSEEVIQKETVVEEPVIEVPEPVVEEKPAVIEVPEPVVEEQFDVIEVPEPVVEEQFDVIEVPEPVTEEKEPVTEEYPSVSFDNNSSEQMIEMFE